MFIVQDDLTLAHALADAAEAIATEYFGQPGLKVRIKADGSPVTDADWVIEAALREHLLRHRPGEAFVGEESGSCGHGGRRWFIDPIDGTRGFLAGRPDWRTLIAVEDAGIIVMGLVSSPALHRRWWATRTGGAWTRQDVGETSDVSDTPLSVSGTARLEQAKIALWPAVSSLPCLLRAPVARLVACATQANSGEHAERLPQSKPPVLGETNHGALLVATGRIDAFMLCGGGPWDLAALVPIVEEAGGRFSDVTGGRSLSGPAAIFSNGLLHEQILRCLLEDSRTETESVAPAD